MRKYLVLSIMLLGVVTTTSHIYKIGYEKGFEEAKGRYLSYYESELHYANEHLEDQVDEKIKLINQKDEEIQALKKELAYSPKIEKYAKHTYTSIPESTFKAWMPYTAITNKMSVQYKLQQNAYTNSRGYRMLDGKYMIAVGSAFGKPGDNIKVTMSTGNTFNAIIGDQKSNKDTDASNMQCIHNGSIIEFIVDKVSFLATSNKFSEFEGYVTKIERY